MRKIISVFTLLRTPIKTILTLLLIVTVTFSLFSQIAEYTVTDREFNENVDRYYGTGMVEAEPVKYKKVEYPYYIESDPRVDSVDYEGYNELRYTPVTEEQMKTISNMSYVSSVYKRYMTAGISEEFYRRDDYEKAYDYAARLVIEGTVYETNKETGHFGHFPPMSSVSIKDCKILGGQADIENLYYKDNTIAFCLYNLTGAIDGMLNYEYTKSHLPLGDFNDSNYFYNNRNLCFRFYTYKYGGNFIDTLQEGDRYVFILRFERQPVEWQNIEIFLYDWLTEPWCKAVWDITEAPENYLELEEYEPLRELVDLTNKDIHTLDVVYADDMSVIKKISENSMQIEQGRWLTPEDTENDNKVCVINNKFAEDNNIKIGDTISLKLGHELFEQFYSLGAVAGTKERLSEEWTDAEFEIVGIYKDRDAYTLSRTPNWTYSSNTVFVPLSSLPLTEEEMEGHEFSPSEFSFKVDNAWDIEAFKEECIPQIEAMGLTVMFDDGGWSEVVKAFTSAQRLAIIRIALLSAVTVIATGFVVYLFISRKRKDYAIMRALGTTKGKAERTLLLPLMVLTAAGVAVGTAVGWIYTANTIAGNSSLEILGDYAVNTSIPLWPVIVCAAGEIALTFIFALFMLKKLGRRSPLELLQGKK